MVQLDAQYIRNHMISDVTTEGSWGRAIAKQVLDAGLEKIGDKSVDSLDIDAKFTISPVDNSESVSPQAPLCIKICLQIGSHVPTCHHFTIYM